MSVDKKKMSIDKKAKILVFGIFFIIVLLVGSTFALFTYSRTGSVNKIVTGNVEFSMLDGSDISLIDAFPQSDIDGNKNDAYRFTVTNNSMDGIELSYDVSLLTDNTVGGVSYFNNENIKYSLKKNGNYVIGSENSGDNLDTINGFANGTSTGDGKVLVGQAIKAKTTDNYELRIWINNSVVYNNTMSENGLMIGAYNNFKYSLRVRVDSNN